MNLLLCLPCSNARISLNAFGEAFDSRYQRKITNFLRSRTCWTLLYAEMSVAGNFHSAFKTISDLLLLFQKKSLATKMTFTFYYIFSLAMYAMKFYCKQFITILNGLAFGTQFIKTKFLDACSIASKAWTDH